MGHNLGMRFHRNWDLELEAVDNAIDYIEEHGVLRDGSYGGRGGPACFIGAIREGFREASNSWDRLPFEYGFGSFQNDDPVIAGTSLIVWNDKHTGGHPRRAVTRALRRYKKWLQENI